MARLLALSMLALTASAASQCGSLTPQGNRCGAACAAKGGAIRNGAQSVAATVLSASIAPDILHHTGPSTPYQPPGNSTLVALAACAVKNPAGEGYQVGTKATHEGNADCNVGGKMVPYSEANCCCAQ